jgi:hypothetical protein
MNFILVDVPPVVPIRRAEYLRNIKIQSLNSVSPIHLIVEDIYSFILLPFKVEHLYC